MATVEIDVSDGDGLQWEGGGYLHRVSQPQHIDLPSDVAAEPLLAFAVILQQCKRGEFENVGRLFEVREASLEKQQNWPISPPCCSATRAFRQPMDG